MRAVLALWALSMTLLGACADPDYAKDLQEPTPGPSEGPGSGEALAALLLYKHQRNNPTVQMKSASCEDVPRNARAGTEVPCTIEYADEEGPDSQLMLVLDENNEWQIRDR
ncbi:MAG: hypothetical protein ICV72_13470 [Aldersonia sp.]|nr:hypothetical protein [Aldersonia sp.]